MIVRYTRQALEDLEEALRYVAMEHPARVSETARTLNALITSLAQYPDRGRIGRVQGTRELVIPRLPYVVAYRVRARQVDVLAILHGARRWPSAFEEH